MVKKIASFILVVFSIATLTSCQHTAHGVGEDMEKAGEKIQKKTE
ncbi:MAG: entericidin A/B family lipoprotein [Nitrospirales bacterium]|nr:entericidin A/B family lipoprotein [Nitrospirales bacterium]